MVVADQLLLSRLKQVCEQLVISQLTLDNVTQVYELSVTFRSEQLMVCHDTASQPVCCGTRSE